MSLCFETIKIQNQKIENIDYHNKRMNLTREALYGSSSDIDLLDFISLPNDQALYRCKVLYAQSVEDVSLYPYKPREIECIKIIRSDIEYRYKFADRSEIDNLFAKREDCDEVLIVDSNGLLRDTTIANIALKLDGRWHTPKHPLLAGTFRQKLLDSSDLIESSLNIGDLKRAEGFALMNAMIGFYEMDKAIGKIFPKL